MTPDALDPTPEQLARITARVMAVVDAPSDTAIGSNEATDRSRRARYLRAALVLAVLGGAVGVRWAHVPQRSLEVRPALQVAPPTVLGLADRARGRPGLVLGAPGAEVGHLVVSRLDEGAEPHAWTEETWITASGTGRRTTTPTGVDRGRPVDDVRVDEPGSLAIVGLAPAQVVGLDGGSGGVLRQLQDALDPGGKPSGLSAGIVELLAWPGVPADVRGALYEALDQIGFTTTVAPDSPDGRVEVTLTGPGPDGSTLTARVDVLSTRPVGLQYSTRREPRPVHHVVTFAVSDFAPVPN